MSIAEYGQLDLGHGSKAAESLAAHLAIESRQHLLALSAPLGATAESPAFLTPGMLSWYQRHVAPFRGTALAEVRGALEADALPNGNRGFLMEAEIDRIEARKLAEMRRERDTFTQKKEIVDLDAEIDRLATEYERKRAEHGRDAQAWSPFSYYVVLGLIAVILEGLLNWESFAKVDGWTPAIATSAFLGVAIAFGTSGHLLGMVLRQWAERFGGNVSARVRSASRRDLAIAAICVALGLLLVLYSRYFLLREAIARQIALGEEAGSTTYLLIAGSIVGNLIAYAIGVAWAYLKHDPVPGFAEDRRRLEQLQARQRRHHSKDLEPRLTQKLLQAQKDVDAVTRRDADQAQKLRLYAQHRAAFEQVRKADAQVLALLEEYRSRLVATARDAGASPRFVYDDPIRPGRSSRTEVEADDYLRKRLKLGHL